MIIATVGSSLSLDQCIELIETLIRQGCYNFRFNLSKPKNKNEFCTMSKKILKIKNRYNHKINMMIDIPYPYYKHRLYIDELFWDISEGSIFRLCSNPKDSHREIQVNSDEISNFVNVGDRIIYSDGVGCYRIIKKESNDSILVCAECSFRMYNGKSLAIPNYVLEGEITREQLDIINEIEPESVACSFVSSPSQIARFNTKLNTKKIISKIESVSGIKNILSIAEYSEIMIARGDLFLQTDIIDLFNIQEKLARLAKKKGRELYVATGILNSLENNYSPTCADIADLIQIIKLNPDAIVLNYGVVAKRFKDANAIINKVKLRYS